MLHVHVRVDKKPRTVRFDLNTSADGPSEVHIVPAWTCPLNVLWYDKADHRVFRQEARQCLRRSYWRVALQEQQQQQENRRSASTSRTRKLRDASATATTKMSGMDTTKGNPNDNTTTTLTPTDGTDTTMTLHSSFTTTTTTTPLVDIRGLEYFSTDNARLRKRRRRQHTHAVLREQEAQRLDSPRDLVSSFWWQMVGPVVTPSRYNDEYLREVSLRYTAGATAEARRAAMDDAHVACRIYDELLENVSNQ